MSPSQSIFVDGLDLSGVIKTGTTRQFHRKSRSGCQRCRARRIKCNEAKPYCHNCVRQGCECIYDRTDRKSPRQIQERCTNSTSPEQVNEHEPAESQERRLAELELMHFYITETGPSLPFDKTASHELYVKAIPRMAFTSEALLYTIFSVSALHRTISEKSDSAFAIRGESARDQHEQYSRLAFHHHYRDLADIRSDNIDTIFLTANLMRLIACFILSQRVLEPYTPPFEWLRISKSHHHLYKTAWEMAGDNRATRISSFLRSAEQQWQNAIVSCNADDATEDFAYLLQACGEVDDPGQWDAATKEAYVSTTRYIAELSRLSDNPGTFSAIARRLIMFPMKVDQHFIDLVEVMSPRALVVLGHYFALLSRLSDFWFIGSSGKREVIAIAQHLSSPWKGMMAWPLEVVSGHSPV